MPKCDHCPLRGRELECPAVAANHPRFCQWVDPEDPGYKPGGADVLLAMAAGVANRPPRPAFPPLARQAATLAGAVVRFAASGMERASSEEKARRLAICGGCEHFTEGRCRKCGCSLAYKVAMRSEHCPVDKW